MNHYCRDEDCDQYMVQQGRWFNHRGREANGAWWNQKAVWTSDGRCKSCGQRMTSEDALPAVERDAIRDAETRKYEERRDRLMKRFRTNEPVWTTTKMIDGRHMVIKYSGRRNGEPWAEEVMEVYDGA